ncbi:hypothetical protein [Microbacterium aurantiacum]|uniref:hypothetical protein n=1 Tax=Microbacterium aurantiacum TaxID=162393 RepID=UPI0034363996
MVYPIILTSPPVIPPLPPEQWQGLTVTWTGADGSVWDLTDRSSGVVLSRAGVEGLHFPRMTKFASKARAIPGRRLRGYRVEERDVFWPIFIWAESTEQFIALSTAFFDSIDPIIPGTWTVKAGAEPARSLRLTGTFEDAHAYAHDPAKDGWEQYGVTLEASDPFWMGETIRRGPWSAPDPQPFFGESGFGPPFYISAAANFDTASIPNPGDVERWGVWRAEGELSSVVLGVGDEVITVPFTTSEGDVLVIDTDPRNPSATLNGADVTPLLGLQDYAPVPPGASVPLRVEAAGPGQIMFDLTPGYFRAF